MFCKKDENGKLIRTEVVLDFSEDQGMTKQSHKDECDINRIMSGYQRTGTVSFVEAREAEYMDVPAVDFHTALNAVKAAEETFAAMPSSLRKEFKNDPGLFMDFVHNPDNIDRMIELGLANAPDGWVEPSKRVPEAPETPPAEAPV